MDQDPGLICYRHCPAGQFVAFCPPHRCPLCHRPPTNLMDTPYRLPYPFRRASQSPCSVVIRPTDGDFLNDYINGASLHMGITDSRGTVHAFDERGLRTDDTESFRECLTVPLTDGDPVWHQYCNTAIREVSGGDWGADRYHEEENNCYNFVLEVIQTLRPPLLEGLELTKLAFCSEYVVPKATAAARYISVFRSVLETGVVSLQARSHFESIPESELEDSEKESSDSVPDSPKTDVSSKTVSSRDTKTSDLMDTVSSRATKTSDFKQSAPKSEFENQIEDIISKLVRKTMLEDSSISSESIDTFGKDTPSPVIPRPRIRLPWNKSASLNGESIGNRFEEASVDYRQQHSQMNTNNHRSNGNVSSSSSGRNFRSSNDKVYQTAKYDNNRNRGKTASKLPILAKPIIVSKPQSVSKQQTMSKQQLASKQIIVSKQQIVSNHKGSNMNEKVSRLNLSNKRVTNHKSPPLASNELKFSDWMRTSGDSDAYITPEYKTKVAKPSHSSYISSWRKSDKVFLHPSPNKRRNTVSGYIKSRTRSKATPTFSTFGKNLSRALPDAPEHHGKHHGSIRSLTSPIKAPHGSIRSISSYVKAPYGSIRSIASTVKAPLLFTSMRGRPDRGNFIMSPRQPSPFTPIPPTKIPSPPSKSLSRQPSWRYGCEPCPSDYERKLLGKIDLKSKQKEWNSRGEPSFLSMPGYIYDEGVLVETRC